MNTPTEAQLQSALELSKEKHKLIKKLAALQEKIAGIDDKIQTALSEESKAPKKETAIKTPKEKTSGEGRHGKLKDQILAALKAAGSEGISIKALSEKIGKDTRPLSVWFSTTGAKNPEIVKISRWVFRFQSVEDVENNKEALPPQKLEEDILPEISTSPEPAIEEEFNPEPNED